MTYDTDERGDALIDLGTASEQTKGNLIVNQDVDAGYRDVIGLSRDD